ncbi:hypothetical protein ACFLRF_03610 [Candidatus Altiarchaeota archaeon]
MVKDKRERLSIRVRDGQPELDVKMLASEVKELGDLPRDNLALVTSIGRKVPGILTGSNLQSAVAEYEEADPTAISDAEVGRIKSFSRDLPQIAEGRGRAPVMNAGMNLKINLLRLDGGLIHAAFPSVPEQVSKVNDIVEGLRARQAAGRSIGISTPLKVLEDEAESFRRVYDLKRDGVDSTDIPARTGLNAAPVGDWLRGKLPFHLAKLARKGVAEFTPSREEDAEFAYMLGAYAAKTKGFLDKSTVAFNHQDRQPVDRVSRVLFGNDPEGKVVERSHGDKNYNRMDYNSKSFVEYMNETTDGNRRLPWEHLVSRKERAAFITGFLDFTGSVAQPSASNPNHQITISRRDRPQLIREVAVLLADLGVFPSTVIKEEGASRLRITHEKDLRALFNLEGFQSEQMKEVQAAVRAIPITEKTEQRASFRQARKQEILGMRKAMPDIDTMGHAFREYGASVTLARRIAMDKGPAQLDEAARILAGQGIDAKEDPILLAQDGLVTFSAPVSVLTAGDAGSVSPDAAATAHDLTAGQQQVMAPEAGSPPVPDDALTSLLEDLRKPPEEPVKKLSTKERLDLIRAAAKRHDEMKMKEVADEMDLED